MERGRWGYRARHSAPGDFSLYAGLRAKKSAWVSRSLPEGRDHAADQLGIWEGLALKMGKRTMYQRALDRQMIATAALFAAGSCARSQAGRPLRPIQSK